MHLYANSMNILGRLQTLPAHGPTPLLTAPRARKSVTKRSFEFHLLGSNGSMSGQWDGDVRRQPSRRSLHAEVPVRVEEEVEVVDPATFWG